MDAPRLASPLCQSVQEELDVPAIPVAIVAAHDTASAVAAIPLSDDVAFLSCGTWALLGAEVPKPVLDARVRAWGFTNEGALGGTYRLLKNIPGLWLVEACRRAWSAAGMVSSHDALLAAATAAPPFTALIDPGAPEFLNPPSMPAAIRAWCVQTGQTPPEEPGAMLRAILESLALTFRRTLDQLEALLDRRFSALHLVGGGVNNTLLCQLTADAIGRPLRSGPVEATTVGNIIAQLMALRGIGSLAEGRDLAHR
ncbi:MAG: rhamnulokinase, partial [Chloroflexota bacterium]